MMPPRRPRPEGFTLLELLVAVAIMALLAVGAYRLLTDTVSTRDRGLAHEQGLADLQRADMILQRDLMQVSARGIRDEFGDFQPAFYIPTDNVMEFTRAGWRNPLQEARSDLVRVRYRVANGQLLREYWHVLDRDRTSLPQRTVLLDKVSGFSVRVFSGGAAGSWSNAWPALSDAQKDRRTLPLPTAVEVRFSQEPWGEIRRVFLLPENDGNVTQTKAG